MRKFYLLFVSVALLASACQTEQSYTENQSRSLNPTATSQVTPVAADLNVSATRIKFETDYTVTKSNGMNAAKAKQFAIAAAVKQHNADVLVAPLVNVNSEKNVIHVVVYGYPATYTNFRKATIQDLRRPTTGGKKRNRS